jgi:hypothetical protein
MNPTGSRAEVFHGTAMKTSGGLMKKDLVLGADGLIKSKQAVKSSLARMKREGDKHLTSVFAPKDDGKFHLQPKKGTKKYKTLVKKMK